MTLSKKYYPQAYHDRNRYMVHQSSRLICCYDGKPGGTAHTIRYSLQHGLKVINTAELQGGIDPLLRLIR